MHGRRVSTYPDASIPAISCLLSMFLPFLVMRHKPVTCGIPFPRVPVVERERRLLLMEEEAGSTRQGQFWCPVAYSSALCAEGASGSQVNFNSAYGSFSHVDDFCTEVEFFFFSSTVTITNDDYLALQLSSTEWTYNITLQISKYEFGPVAR